MTWDKWTNQRIVHLHPLIVSKCEKAINRCEKELEIKVRITQDGHYRAFAVSDEFYTYSRTQEQLDKVGLGYLVAKPKGKWKTNARGGYSYHNFGLAVDVCLIGYNGKAVSFKIPEGVAKIFEEEGFDWLYRKIKKDKPHFQITFGLSTKDLREMRLYNKGLRYLPIITG